MKSKIKLKERFLFLFSTFNFRTAHSSCKITASVQRFASITMQAEDLYHRLDTIPILRPKREELIQFNKQLNALPTVQTSPIPGRPNNFLNSRR